MCRRSRRASSSGSDDSVTGTPLSGCYCNNQTAIVTSPNVGPPRMCRAPAAGGAGGTDLFAAGGLLAGVVEVPAGAVGAEGADEAELVPFVDSGAADAVPGGELPAGDGVAGAWRAARGGDLIAGRAGLAGLVEAEAAVVGRGEGEQAQLGPAQDGAGGDAERGRELPAGEQVPGAF